MRTIAFMVSKGGVGKTISSVNVAYILAAEKGKKVLLIDLDPQGNASKAYQIQPEKLNVADLMINKSAEVQDAIYATKYPNISVIPADRALLKANQQVLLDSTSVQQLRLRRHLKTVENEYDYCVFDCPTDVSMSTLNALAMTDDVMIPVKIDSYSFDAIMQVSSIIEDMQDFNPKLKLAGCFVNMYQNNNLCRNGVEVLRSQTSFYTFQTVIRNTVKVSESTYASPLYAYAPRSTAAQDYRALVEEYIQRCSS